MPNYAYEVAPGIWKWEGDYWIVGKDKKWIGPFVTQEAALVVQGEQSDEDR